MSGVINFKTFRLSGLNNAWLKEPGISLYVRRVDPSQEAKLGTYVIANMTATTPGKGALTKFLDKYEAAESFTFENVINVRLIAYLARRGYTVRTDTFDYPPRMRRGFESARL